MFFIAPLHAQTIPLPNPLAAFSGASDIPKLIGFVLRGLFGVIGTIALVVFIYAGFLWMTALGDEGKVKRGRETMVWAGMGLVLIFGSYTAVDFILKALLGS